MTMSLHNRLSENAKQDLRQVEREVQRQMELLDLYLQHLCKEPCAPAACASPILAPGREGSSPQGWTWSENGAGNRYLPAFYGHRHPFRQDEGSFGISIRNKGGNGMQRSVNGMLNPSHDHRLLALMDVEGFDPKEVTVTVKDGKVKVLAEHKEECTTARGKEYNYRNIMKEISLPPGVSEDQATYSLGPKSVLKIEMAHKRCPCLLSH